jgi:alkanesulfonate monooxygenase SsuD/methylene tetrahydromethanopterin reductase-like flavin-dependent oxidoreductase (luciferase family)
LEKYGRLANDIKIAPGIYFILGETHDQALANENELNELVDVATAAERLSTRLGIDLKQTSLDQVLVVDSLKKTTEVNGIRSRHDIILELIGRDNLTFRQLIYRLAGGRGHYHFVGTPLAMVDFIEEWYIGHAADAFNLMPSVYGRDFPLFIEKVVPELQRRGLFRKEYQGSTLRDHYGLNRPKNTVAREQLVAV